MDFVFNLISLL